MKVNLFLFIYFFYLPVPVCPLRHQLKSRKTLSDWRISFSRLNLSLAILYPCHAVYRSIHSQRKITNNQSYSFFTENQSPFLSFLCVFNVHVAFFLLKYTFLLFKCRLKFIYAKTNSEAPKIKLDGNIDKTSWFK